MLFNALTSLLTILSLIGVVLNIKKKQSCFIIWAVTNFSWTIVDFYREIYAQAVLFAIYFVLAIWGLVEWRKDSRLNK
ncbi:nicotinamide mononucleotide transporter family protein [Candidatus Micrarchaeota archaeon]|jgi:nicotinamide riboside transporter PnuC|nr:nicotinamide mononucleotide transporter family protein [Candidatus Micrarchaeota archaeon]